MFMVTPLGRRLSWADGSARLAGTVFSLDVRIVRQRLRLVRIVQRRRLVVVVRVFAGVLFASIGHGHIRLIACLLVICLHGCLGCRGWMTDIDWRRQTTRRSNRTAPAVRRLPWRRRRIARPIPCNYRRVRPCNRLHFPSRSPTLPPHTQPQSEIPCRHSPHNPARPFSKTRKPWNAPCTAPTNTTRKRKSRILVTRASSSAAPLKRDRKSTRLNSSH